MDILFLIFPKFKNKELKIKLIQEETSAENRGKYTLYAVLNIKYFQSIMRAPKHRTTQKNFE